MMKKGENRRKKQNGVNTSKRKQCCLENNKGTNLKQNGITLIALVITIIVLLILAGVTIATLTGDNGILTKATEASTKTSEAEAEEQVKLAIAGSIGANGEIDNEDLKDNLNMIEGIEEVGDISDSDYPISVTVDGEYSYLINKDGTLGEIVKREGIKVGDYVNYEPDANETGYTTDKLSSDITGSSSNKSAITQDDLKWRILNIDASGRVDLISETPTSQTVYFQGARGYNNGVYVINDICKSLYSNNSLGITARSLDLKDIEDKMNATGKAKRDGYANAVQYGKTKTYGSGYNQYPNLYAQENGSGINTEKVKTDGIDVNADGYSSPTTEDSSTANEGLTVTQTYYYFSNTPSSYFDDQEFHDMVFNTGSYYWLASRDANCDSPDATFGLRSVNNSSLSGNYMFNSHGNTNNNLRVSSPRSFSRV